MSYGVDMVKIELYRSVDWVAQVAPKMTSAYVTNGNGNKVGSYAWTVPADIGTTPALAKSGGGSIPAVWGIKVRTLYTLPIGKQYSMYSSSGKKCTMEYEHLHTETWHLT